MNAFLDKGRLRPLLESIPVQVITNDKAGLLGAARCAAAKSNAVLAGRRERIRRCTQAYHPAGSFSGRGGGRPRPPTLRTARTLHYCALRWVDSQEPVRFDRRADASASLPWDQMFFFWGDERHVPPEPDSNYRVAKETLLSKVPRFRARQHFPRPLGESGRFDCSRGLQQTLRKFFALAPGEFPRFDLILLGMGPDGHTASLFPETAALQEKSRLVANWVEKLKTSRITFHAASAKRSPVVLRSW